MNTDKLISCVNKPIYKLFNFYASNIWFSKFKSRNKSIYFSIKKNVDFKGKHNGETCYIVASGPSLAKQDLSVLDGKFVFTVNQISRNNQYSAQKFKSTYHIWSDNRFFDLSEEKEEDMELLNVIKQTVNPYSSPVCFFKHSMKKTIEKYGLNDLMDCRYYCERDLFFDGYIKRPNFAKTVPCFSTVVHYAIWLAIYMGFKTINLLGCDCTSIINTINVKTNTNLNAAEYMYKITENEKKRMSKALNKYDMLSETFSFYKMLDNYHLLDLYCKKKGVRLVNMTEGGVLDFIENSKLM